MASERVTWCYVPMSLERGSCRTPAVRRACGWAHECAYELRARGNIGGAPLAGARMWHNTHAPWLVWPVPAGPHLPVQEAGPGRTSGGGAPRRCVFGCLLHQARPSLPSGAAEAALSWQQPGRTWAAVQTKSWCACSPPLPCPHRPQVLHQVRRANGSLCGLASLGKAAACGAPAGWRWRWRWGWRPRTRASRQPAPPCTHFDLCLCLPAPNRRCIDFTDVHVQGGKVAFAPSAAAPSASAASGASLAPGVAPAACSQALVTVRWLGFRRIWRGTGQGEALLGGQGRETCMGDRPAGGSALWERAAGLALRRTNGRGSSC